MNTHHPGKINLIAEQLIDCVAFFSFKFVLNFNGGYAMECPNKDYIYINDNASLCDSIGSLNDRSLCVLID